MENKLETLNTVAPPAGTKARNIHTGSVVDILGTVLIGDQLVIVFSDGVRWSSAEFTDHFTPLEFTDYFTSL